MGTTAHPPPPDSWAARFAARLKATRIQSGFATVAQAVKATGLPHSSLAAYESGTNTPTVERLATLAVTYRCATDYLLLLSDHPQGLPAGGAVLDVRMLERIRACSTLADLARVLQGQDPVLFTDLPSNCRMVTVQEALRIRDAIQEHMDGLR